jgi:hypothetical protein
MTTVRQFYDLHLIGNYNDWRAQQLDLRRAMNFAVVANQFADWVFNHCRTHAPHRVAGCKEPADFRWRLVGRCGDFRHVWNIADGHKHMELKKPERVRPVSAVPGAFALGVFDQMAFDTSHLVIVLEDDTGRGLPELFSGVARMWDELLKEWGL